MNLEVKCRNCCHVVDSIPSVTIAYDNICTGYWRVAMLPVWFVQSQLANFPWMNTPWKRYWEQRPVPNLCAWQLQEMWTLLGTWPGVHSPDVARLLRVSRTRASPSDVLVAIAFAAAASYREATILAAVSNGEPGEKRALNWRSVTRSAGDTRTATKSGSIAMHNIVLAVKVLCSAMAAATTWSAAAVCTSATFVVDGGRSTKRSAGV
mmetsp:Transcript_72860/g.115792  ORF Transcript_72860/g.115792 Transcript_72860/m.115792 type:complete len:208 (+) Transcript_72860:1285-1908(+)